jgi:hypothetical protein
MRLWGELLRNCEGVFWSPHGRFSNLPASMKTGLSTIVWLVFKLHIDISFIPVRLRMALTL